MKHPRTALLAVVFLASCGSKSAGTEPGTESSRPGSSLTKPVAAPVQLGKSVIRDLRKQTRAANQRKQDFDALMDQGR